MEKNPQRYKKKAWGKRQNFWNMSEKLGKISQKAIVKWDKFVKNNHFRTRYQSKAHGKLKNIYSRELRNLE